MSSGTPTPSGTVTFRGGTTVLGVVPLNAFGQTMLTTNALVGGVHKITAVYSGDANNNASTSAVLTQTVVKAPTSLTLITSVTPALVGQTVTFTSTLTVVPPGAGMPTGVVSFFNGAVLLGTATPSAAGVASLPTNALTVGPRTITARYAGDPSFAASAAPALTETIVKAPTVLTLVSAANPAVWHQPVSFTATVSVVAPGSGKPTGTVTFLDGATTVGTGTLNATGQVSLTTAALAVGNHSITARYAGSTSFNGSVSTVLPQAIVRAASATSLTAVPNPSVTGQPVVLTATVNVVAPATGTPTGVVSFAVGGTPLLVVPLNAARQAKMTVPPLSVGAAPFTATYGGDGNVAPSTSPTLTGTINPGGTTTVVASAANPAVFGKPVTFTATVNVVAPAKGTPTGTVTFLDGATPLGMGTLNAARQATFTTDDLAVGARKISAAYAGDGILAPSTSVALTETITKAATKTTIASSLLSLIRGQDVTLTANVSVVAPGAGTPTGTVTFLDGATVLGAAPLSVAGQASLTTDALNAGARSITARYVGDSSFATSVSPALVETVAKAATTTDLSSSASSGVFGQPIQLRAAVAAVAPGAGTPTGMITFLNGTTPLGTAPLVGGTASLTTSALALGPHTLTARYAGDVNYITSTSAPQAAPIAKASTTTSLSASANPAVSRQPVTFTALVSALAPSTTVPTGTVTFFVDGATQLGVVALTAGKATLTTNALTVGNHSITASYAGTANLNGSASTVLGEEIRRAASTTTLTAVPNPVLIGRPVVLTATVSVLPPGGGTPTGSLTFFDGGVALATVTLNAARQATLTTSTLTVGPHALTAAYGGNATVAQSTSAILTETVNKGGTTTTLTASPNPGVLGSPVTFTATVNVVAPATGTPTGSVTFLDDTTPLATVTLNAARQATLTASTLTLGPHKIKVSYAGDARFDPSTSLVLTQTIKGQPPTITSANTTSFTAGVGSTFTVTTTGKPTNVITRTGTWPAGVSFTDNGDNTATIGGTPAAGTLPGPYPAVITATNGISPNAVQNFTLRVLCSSATVAGTIPPLTVNSAMAPATFTQTGGTGTIRWTATGLPPGTSIGTSNGQVTGTPTATGTFNATITVDAGGCVGSKTQSVTVAPVAMGDSYNGLVDNTQLVVTGGTTASPTTPFVSATARLTTNDLPNGGVTATPGTVTTTAGGSVTIAADGTFRYTPKANPGGAATTSDSFTYTVTSNTGGGATVTSAPATVTLNLAGRVWYVKNNGPAGNGQSPTPFSTLAAATTASTASDTIYIYQGSGTTGLTTPSILKTGQKLIGQGVALVVNGTTLVPAGGFPLLGSTVTLASGVTVAGIDMSMTTANGIVGTSVAGISVAVRDLTTTTGTAVTIGGAGNSGSLSFRKISAAGGANGIILQNLTGSFSVEGDGANTTVGGNGSGGTIANMTGADTTTQSSPFPGVGIYLNNVQNVTLRRMTINGTNQNYGIRGFAVNGFTLEYSTVGGTNGTAATLPSPEEAGEGSVYLGNATTTGLMTSGTFTGNVIEGGRARNLSIVDSTPGVTTLTLKGNRFGANQNQPDADDSVAVEARNVGTSLSAIVGGPTVEEKNNFTGAPGELASFVGQAGTTMDVLFQNNVLSNGHLQNVVGGGGMTLGTQGTMTFTVDDNVMLGADGSALTLFKASDGALLSGRVSNNSIGVTGMAESGSRTAHGIFVVGAGTGTLGLTITGNTIRQYDGAGIYADNTDGSYTANFTITGNTTAEPDVNAFAGLVITNGAPGSGDTVKVCAKITSNNFSAGDPGNSTDILLGVSGAAAGHPFNLPGYTGTTLANVQTFLANANTNSSATAVSAYADPPAAPSAFTGTGTSCPTP